MEIFIRYENTHFVGNTAATTDARLLFVYLFSGLHKKPPEEVGRISALPFCVPIVFASFATEV